MILCTMNKFYSKKEQKFPLTLCVIRLQTANGFNISGKLCIKYLYGYDVTPKFVFCFFFSFVFFYPVKSVTLSTLRQKFYSFFSLDKPGLFQTV